MKRAMVGVPAMALLISVTISTNFECFIMTSYALFYTLSKFIESFWNYIFCFI